METARRFVGEAISGETDDTTLHCCACKLNFTSLYSKQSHYSGKLHLKALLENIDAAVKSESGGEDFGIRREGSQTGDAVALSLTKAASEYRSKFEFSRRVVALFVIVKVTPTFTINLPLPPFVPDHDTSCSDCNSSMCDKHKVPSQ